MPTEPTHDWYAIVLEGRPPWPRPPRGPWHGRAAAEEALKLWQARATDAAGIVSHHRITITGPFCTSAIARYVCLQDHEEWLCPDTEAHYRRPVTQRERLLLLAEEGFTQDEAARELGVSRPRITYLLDRLRHSGAIVATGTREGPGRYPTVWTVPEDAQPPENQS